MKQQDTNSVIGNNYSVDYSHGFKSEIRDIYDAYAKEGVNLLSWDMYNVITSPTTKHEFIEEVTESFTNSPLFTDPQVAKSPFYDNYGERFEQLLDNSLFEVAKESAILGYAPIVSYNPFFLKKQWIDCIFKDVVMTEIPKTPVINLAFERRYVKTLAGDKYSLPEALYDEDTMKILYAEATGLNFDEKERTLPIKREYLIDPDYIPTVIAGDQAVEITLGIHVFQVTLQGTETNTSNPSKEYVVPVNVKVDATTHNFINGKVSYKVYDTSTNPPTYLETLEDTLIGKLDTDGNTITLMSENDVITKVCIRGKAANRFNNRSLDVVREVEQLQYTMPESGPRLNTSVTVEDVADAAALQNIDVLADNIDIMGRILANFEDSEINMFLKETFTRAEAVGKGPFGYDYSMVVRGGFDALPYTGYTQNVSQWMKDSREYFERVLAGLKPILKSPDLVVVAVAHPNTIRFLQDGINWIFNEDTQISGMKLGYHFGIYTSAQDRVHFITSLRVSEDEGIRLVVISMNPELVTFKHYKYSTIIDRNYRNPMHTLTPNIMATMRTLTFEVLPVQGLVEITGRDMFSPTTLERTP